MGMVAEHGSGAGSRRSADGWCDRTAFRELRAYQRPVNDRRAAAVDCGGHLIGELCRNSGMECCADDLDGLHRVAVGTRVVVDDNQKQGLRSLMKRILDVNWHPPFWCRVVVPGLIMGAVLSSMALGA